MKLTYVVPVHNETRVLRAKVAVLVEGLAARGGGEVLLVENGSADDSWALCQEIEREHTREPHQTGAVAVRALTVPAAGIGHAYDRGLRAMLDASTAPNGDPKAPDAERDDERWAVLTAADLPFGFTDLDAASEHMQDTRMIIGSKAHPQSHIEVDTQRRVASAVYKLARQTVLGSRVGDSQGSVFVRKDLARDIVPKVKARGFFYSTELVFFAERAGVRVVEVPVTLEKNERKSTVKPVKHGLTMFGQLVELRTRGARTR
jgi:hypothetical protein